MRGRRWPAIAAWLGVFALLLQTAVVPHHLGNDVAEDMAQRLAASSAASHVRQYADIPHHRHGNGRKPTPAHPAHADCFICLSLQFAGTSPLPDLPLLPPAPTMGLRLPLPPATSLAADGLRIALPPSRAPPATA